jgi:pimeloyl-ACP methyl ester carboxylesterase
MDCRRLEALLADMGSSRRFCHGDQPTLADCCLVPQVFNARRFEVDLSECPRLLEIDAPAMHCRPSRADIRAWNQTRRRKVAGKYLGSGGRPAMQFRFVPMDVGLRLVWGMPDAELHFFDRCGRRAQWEYAVKFNQMVLEFLGR